VLPALATAFGLATAARPARALSGAIFTTDAVGGIVNENVHYEAKEDVYLDGGPGPNAPPGAAGLPPGDYYFQVTDPSGSDLLSSDHISCRRIRVGGDGVIDSVYAGTNYVKDRGALVVETCRHEQGVDGDHSGLGAITVQLFPYDDTPNRGGVYKVWVTPVSAYACDADFVPAHHRNVNNEGCTRFHGFIPAYSKTDTYKIRRNGGGPPFVAPTLLIRKFHDRDTDGIEDLDEEEILGWAIDLKDPLGVVCTLYTRVIADASTQGVYLAAEETPAGSLQTVGILDGGVVSLFPTAEATVSVPVLGNSEEAHEIVFGNVGVGEITACKVLDANANGLHDPGESTVPGWRFELNGLDASGAAVGPLEQTSGSDGCTTFAALLPGSYRVEEILPENTIWTPTGPLGQDFEIDSILDGAVLTGSSHLAAFTNVCLIEADFDTKGYWHNKNGLAELLDSDIEHVNTLAPYAAPSSYFGAGDEPFDGVFTHGAPVPASHGILGDEIAPEGSARAEISSFLVDENAGGDPQEQLAQQLLAFIFNTRHNLGAPDGAIQLPDGTLMSAQSLIERAILTWSSGTDAERHAMQELLDTLNNDDALPVASPTSCEIVYP
jgi:hypothetical protein